MNLKIKGFSHSLAVKFGILVSAAIISFSAASVSYAQPESPCDPQYMDALEAKAWMEAQREISQNKNYIYKPDSVLEYTCFDMFLREAAGPVPGSPNRQFSETDRWGGHPTGFDADSTNLAMENLVAIPMMDYLVANFNTEGDMGFYLNNRTDFEYGPIDGDVPDGDYACDQMAQVWDFARCENFIEQTIFDGFYDFLFYENVDWDPRMEIQAWNMACDAGDPRYAQGRASAFNDDQVLFDVTTEVFPPEGDGTPYDEDDIVTYLPFILPGGCGTSLEVPTGIQVQRPDLNGGAAYPERVCTNPGCSAVPGGGCTN